MHRNCFLYKQKIVKKVWEYFPHEMIDYNMNGTGNLQLFLWSKEESPLLLISIPHRTSWADMQPKIKQRLQMEHPGECSICWVDREPFTRNCCFQCIGEWCLNCHIQIMIKNKGLNICPFCRHTDGVPVSKDLLGRKMSRLAERSYNIHYYFQEKKGKSLEPKETKETKETKDPKKPKNPNNKNHLNLQKFLWFFYGYFLSFLWGCILCEIYILFYDYLHKEFSPL